MHPFSSLAQSLQEYYERLTRVNASHGLAPSESLNLFYRHMLPSLRNHLASLYLIADEKEISVDQAILLSRDKKKYVKQFLLHFIRAPSVL